MGTAIMNSLGTVPVAQVCVNNIHNSSNLWSSIDNTASSLSAHFWVMDDAHGDLKEHGARIGTSDDPSVMRAPGVQLLCSYKPITRRSGQPRKRHPRPFLNGSFLESFQTITPYGQSFSWCNSSVCNLKLPLEHHLSFEYQVEDKSWINPSLIV